MRSGPYTAIRDGDAGTSRATREARVIHGAEVGAKTFDRPAGYTYTCKEQLWAYRQIIVVE